MENDVKDSGMATEKLADDQGTERIVITVRETDGGAGIRQAFVGRWLVGDADNGVSPEMDDSGVRWNHNSEYSVAKTKRGQLAVYERSDSDEDAAATLVVHENFDEMKDAEMDSNPYPMYPDNILALVAEALDLPYEVDLDI